MKLYGVQLDTVWHEPERNFKRIDGLLDEVAVEPGSLVCLPETFGTGFTMDVRGQGETPDGPSSAFMAKLAKRLQCWVVGGAVFRGRNKGANVALAFDPRGVQIARYDKIHPFSFGQEPQHYRAGRTLVSFRWDKFTVVPLICYDLRFPELFRKATFELGAEIFLVIANWPNPRGEHWTTLLAARAIENQAYVLGLNRCGHDPKVDYPGASRILDHQGIMLAEAAEQEVVIGAAVDRGALVAWRKKFPALADSKLNGRVISGRNFGAVSEFKDRLEALHQVTGLGSALAFKKAGRQLAPMATAPP